MGNDYSKARKVIYYGTNGSFELWTGEARNARYYDNIDLTWQRPYWFNVGRACKYRPDFYLPSINLYIEVKNMDPDYLLDDDLAIEKMQMFYELGHNLYVVDGQPVTDPGFAYRKFQESGKIFFSDKYLQPNYKIGGLRKNGFVLFGKGDNGKPMLKHADYWLAIDYIEEAQEAKVYDFDNQRIDFRKMFERDVF